MIVRDTEGDSLYAVLLVNVQEESELSRDVREKMRHEGWTFVNHTFHITYDYWTAGVSDKKYIYLYMPC